MAALEARRGGTCGSAHRGGPEFLTELLRWKSHKTLHYCGLDSLVHIKSSPGDQAPYRLSTLVFTNCTDTHVHWTSTVR